MKGSRAQRHFHSPRRPSLTFRLRPWNDLPLEGPSCTLFFHPSGGLSARFGFGALYRSVYGELMWGLNQNPSPRVDPELEYHKPKRRQACKATGSIVNERWRTTTHVDGEKMSGKLQCCDRDILLHPDVPNSRFFVRPKAVSVHHRSCYSNA